MSVEKRQSWSIERYAHGGSTKPHGIYIFYTWDIAFSADRWVVDEQEKGVSWEV